MASQSKVEPLEQPSAMAASIGGTEAPAERDAVGHDESAMEDEESAAPVSAAASPVDDEDVSLDELMISDGFDDDDQDDATEVHEGLHRVAMQELNAPYDQPLLEEPLALGEMGLAEDGVDELIVAVSAAADSTEVIPPRSEERAASASLAEDSAPSSEAPSIVLEAEDLDESPEAAAARAAADQEAVAARATLDRAAEQSASELDEPVADALVGSDLEGSDLEGSDLEGSDLEGSDLEGSDLEGALVVADDALEVNDVADLPSEAVETSLKASGEDASPPPLEGVSASADDDVEPPSVRVARPDAPLPSFDIIEVENSSNGRRRPLGLASELEARASARAITPDLAPLSPLSEVSDDEDEDAVTHIGLPVPESAGDYAGAEAGFEPAEAPIAALPSFDPSLSVLDARRATTRVIPRVDAAKLVQGAARALDTTERRADTMRPLAGSVRPARLGAWFSGLWGKPMATSLDALSAQASTSDGRRNWWRERVLPPLSLILFGSGIGAGILLLLGDGGSHGSGQSQALQALGENGAVKRPTTLLERAEAGQGEALFKITNMSPEERTSALTLALEAGYRAQKLNEFAELSKDLKSAPKELSAATVARIIGYATSPETMLPTFAMLSEWTGSLGPDVIYAIGEKAPGGGRAASLAQQLLQSADQRSKATPALSVAVDLRAARTCDDYLAVLPAVARSGDQRCSAALRSIKHTDGCGDNGQLDCYPCLRDGAQLDEALAAVEQRPAPAL